MSNPQIGNFNHLECSIGARGMGKTTWQQYRAWRLQRESGAYVIGHSIGARLNTKLPPELGGHKLPIEYHTTLRKLERALRRRPQNWHILSPPIQGDGHKIDPHAELETADSLLQFSTRLSTAVRRSAWERAHPFRLWNPNVSYGGVSAPPIIVIIDEGIAIEAAGKGRTEGNRWFLEFIYSIRHLHIALLYAIQDGSARSWRVLEQATMIYVFAIRHAWALQCMQAAGASPEEIERIRRLGKYEHVTIASLDVKMLEKSSDNRMPE